MASAAFWLSWSLCQSRMDVKHARYNATYPFEIELTHQIIEEYKGLIVFNIKKLLGFLVLIFRRYRGYCLV